jgi:hypothetical protein
VACCTVNDADPLQAVRFPLSNPSVKIGAADE